MSNASPIDRTALTQPGAASARVPLSSQALPVGNSSTTGALKGGVEKVARQPFRAKRLSEVSDWDDEGADSYDEFYDDPTRMQEWVRKSPGWLTSMVLHMVVLLLMALITVDDARKPEIRDLVVDKAELDEPLEEFNEKQIEKKLEPQVEKETALTELTTMSVSTEDFKIESEEVVVPADADQAKLALSVDVKMSDLLMVDSASSDLLSTVGGLSKSGLGGRTAAGRTAMIHKAGGTADSERAVEAALTWLADKQLRDGSWSFQQIGSSSDPGTNISTRMGATGMTLLPFLGAGYTHESGKYDENIRAALGFMVGNMVVSGGRGRLYEEGEPAHAHMYSHGIASIALCEAYGMTRNRKLQAPAQYALNYIAWAQYPETGGWLYTPRSKGGDTSVVGWQLMALKSGNMAGLQIPPGVVPKASGWLDSVQFNSGAAYGYRQQGDRPANGAMTAVGLLMRMYIGWDHNNPALQMGVAELSKSGPSNTDMYYNYYATQVMRHYGGSEWEKWNVSMRDYLVRTQAREGANSGSWYFGGPHGAPEAGRLYHTALATMILEVYYRHLPIYQSQSSEQEFPVN